MMPGAASRFQQQDTHSKEAEPGRVSVSKGGFNGVTSYGVRGSYKSGFRFYNYINRRRVPGARAKRTARRILAGLSL